VNTEIFRRVSIERLSSPEQLDQLLKVNSTRSWAALLAVLVLVSMTVVWAFRGSIATTAPGQGVIVRTGGVLNVVSSGSGVVASLNIKVRDRIRKNQVIAQVAQPALVERIRATAEAIAEAERQRAVASQIRSGSAKLQMDALNRQRENADREIKVLQEQAKLVSEQIPVEAELLAKGLLTRQQTIATQQKLVEIEGRIAAISADLKRYDSEQFAIESQPLQADVEMQSRVTSLERELAGLRKELEVAADVVSPYSGEVTELRVAPGSAVTAGEPILTIQPDLDQLDVLVYVPSVMAKQIHAGLEAQISPSTVRREEYGYLRGEVTSVADYPATPAALMRNFQNEPLVGSLTGGGPVTELHVRLIADNRTPSGYRWSSPLGPRIKLSSGTLVSAQIVTKRQPPISLVIPQVKEMLGLS
jgi:HlyD family secretion protein